MLLAARLLRDTADPLAAVARTVGYGSDPITISPALLSWGGRAVSFP